MGKNGIQLSKSGMHMPVWLQTGPRPRWWWWGRLEGQSWGLQWTHFQMLMQNRNQCSRSNGTHVRGLWGSNWWVSSSSVLAGHVQRGPWKPSTVWGDKVLHVFFLKALSLSLPQLFFRLPHWIEGQSRQSHGGSNLTLQLGELSADCLSQDLKVGKGGK